MGNISTLAIETSCDDTSIGIVSYDNNIFAVEKLLAYSQVQDHQPYGGVVPELASRLHSEKIVKVLENIGYDSIKDVDFISVTVKPGLPGSLIVGRATAYMIAEYFNKPVKEINHIHGHIFSLFLERNVEDIKFPMVVLTASGGHNDLYLIDIFGRNAINHVSTNDNNISTKPIDRLGQYVITKLGRSLDDAAGECYDKVSKMLGGPYPGGFWVDTKAKIGKHVPGLEFPRIFLSSKEYNFSFSGMKSHMHYFLEELKKSGQELTEELTNDLCYEFAQAISEVLAKKLIKAGIEFKAKTLGFTGGVSASDLLFSYVVDLLEQKKAKNPDISHMTVIRPVKKVYSTDNAAMIGLVGILENATNLMKKRISFEDFIANQDFFIKEAKNNKIFIYPTDTIYGIGCLSTDENKRKINRIKQREEDKFVSVIVPDEKRILTNYTFPGSKKIVTKEIINEYLNRYHGTTFIFDPFIFGGVRIIKHPFQDFVKKLGRPFITTSVNLAGQVNCASPDQISPDILPHVDYIIDAGVLGGKASVIVNLVSGEILER